MHPRNGTAAICFQVSDFPLRLVEIVQDAERIHASKPRANWNPDHCGQLRPNGFFGTFISLPVVLEGFDATMAVRYTRFTLTCKPS
jgi:hypothetical protein